MVWIIYAVVTIDNLVNSRSAALKRVEKLTGKRVTFYQCDMLDALALEAVFSKHHFDYVIHFAAIKAVGESMSFPLLYYKNNVIGTINLIEAMKKYGVSQLVFSSSCTVYGDPAKLPITEDHPTGDVTNVYGRTKYLIEEMLKDLVRADPDKWNIISLRYFNPVGAHPSGDMGEDPTKPFTNLMPYISQVAIGKRDKLTIFGNDYDTVDGTGVRDYIHVMDLVSGHVAALARLDSEHLSYKNYNLGLGHGLSVLELKKEFEKVCGKEVPYVFEPRRLGDVATLYCTASLAERELNWKATRDVRVMWTGAGVSVLQLVRAFETATNTKVDLDIQPRREGDIVAMYADTSLSKRELKWQAKYSLADMCEDFWRWQTKNPNGYEDEEAYEPATLDVSHTKGCRTTTPVANACSGNAISNSH
ncbi:UDP-glucose 4-epimerase [Trinorchestia longiramus]|nr:UDP-glucose 4-epimerase [Trinorchestia longiramus]